MTFQPTCLPMQRKHLILTLSALAASTALVGCGEDAPPPPPPPPPAPKVAAPEAPKVTPISELMAKYDIDPRVNLPEERAPATDPERIAVLKFFDVFARGNADALKPMLSPPDQFELDKLVASGAFKQNTDPITRIDVRCGTQKADACTLAVFHVADKFQPQLWVYKVGGPIGETTEFDAFATPPNIMDRLSGENHIAAWYEIVQLEIAKADEPDTVLEIPQKDFTEAEAEKPSGSGPATPGTPGGMPGKRTPGAPIKPPKPPGFGQQ